MQVTREVLLVKNETRQAPNNVSVMKCGVNNANENSTRVRNGNTDVVVRNDTCMYKN